MVYLSTVLGIVCRVMEVIDLFFNFRLYVRLQVREVSYLVAPPIIYSFSLQRFIYDFRILKGDYNDSCHGALERLASSNAFELAMAEVKQSHPPADLGGLQSASPKEISDNQQ